MNQYGRENRPFLFFIDYEMNNWEVLPLDGFPHDILYDFTGNKPSSLNLRNPILFDKIPISYNAYKKGYDTVLSEIKKGNSFLLNLSYPTRILSNLSISDIYHSVQAKYKFLYKNNWVCFSPETFVKIEDGYIYSYPMKGTIDASIPDAKNVILSDKKEKAEHNTIIDLIRNDLSRVAEKVHVSKYRYLDKISTIDKELLQVSSEIKGKLADDYRAHLGDIFFQLLPAGSISGAPKKKTLEIIRNSEQGDRGFYTGIGGVYDGENLDSAVLIRFIENRKNEMYYRSGGGITYMSNPESEYQEMVDKVYLPIEKKSRESSFY